MVYTQLNGFKYNKWLNSSVWSIDGTWTGAIAPGQSGPRSNAMKEYSAFLNSPELESQHQMQFNIISRTLVGEGGLTPPVNMPSVYSTAKTTWLAVFYTSDKKGDVMPIGLKHILPSIIDK